MPLTADEYEILVRHGEDSQVEFKERIDLRNKENSAEFIRDIIALVNSHGHGSRNMLIGVENATGDLKDISALGLDDADLQQLVDSNVEPAVRFEYRTLDVKGKTVGYIEVAESRLRFHMAKKPFTITDAAGKSREAFARGDRWIRHGSSKGPVSTRDEQLWREEIERSALSLPPFATRMASNLHTVTRLKISASGKNILAYAPGHNSPPCYLWDVARARRVSMNQLDSHRANVLAAGFIPNDQILVVFEGYYEIVHVDTGQSLQSMAGYGNREGVTAAAFAPDLSRFVFAHSNFGLYHQFHQMGGGHIIYNAGQGCDPLALTEDGRLLAAAQRNSLFLYGLGPSEEQDRPVRIEAHWGDIVGLALSPGNDLVATACDDHTARIFHTADGNLIASLEGHRQAVMSIAFSSDGMLLATGGLGGEIIIWAVSDAFEVMRFQAHEGGVSALAFMPNGSRLLSAGRDGTLKAWSRTW